ncbi:MAG: thioesterase family protein [Paraglaciecola sp.]|nr:thioesterase family protein [Paraglaciecola sp.]NCT49052.1 thioesterase family protein [Paraglaciecola sp.]
MHIDDLIGSVIKQISPTQTHASLSVAKTWAQGRTLYGGISAALIFAGMRQLVPHEKLIRALNTSFIGPIEADQPFTIELTILREGKNATQVQGKIIQDQKPAVLMLASFGVARASKVEESSHSTHAMPVPIKPNFIPPIPKVVPSFLGHFDLVKERGGWPFTANKDSQIHGWMRLKKAPTAFTTAHLVALIDVWPPTVLQQLRWPAPASTMSWNLEFIHPHADFSPTQWFAYQALTRQASNGYAHTEANVWDEHGRLVAISRQTVAVFD